jgi:hypothetical protein
MNSSKEIPVNADCSELLPLRIPLSIDQSDRNSLAADDAYLQWSENFDFGVDEMTPFASIISAVLPRISNAPIRFNERIIYHVYESEGDIWKSLRSFYSAESLKQIYKIVGSLGKYVWCGIASLRLLSSENSFIIFHLRRFCRKSHHGADVISDWPSRLCFAAVS